MSVPGVLCTAQPPVRTDNSGIGQLGELGELFQSLQESGSGDYFSNVKACKAAAISSRSFLGRDAHHQSLREHFADAPPPQKTQRLSRPWPTAFKRPKARNFTPCANTLPSRCRHHHVRARFRQFLLRGLAKVKGEWNLVTLAWNLKRMFVLKAA